MELQKVDKETFYTKMNPLDVIVESREDYSNWRLRGTKLIGRTFPGYREPHLEKQYFLVKDWNNGT